MPCPPLSPGFRCDVYFVACRLPLYFRRQMLPPAAAAAYAMPPPR